MNKLADKKKRSKYDVKVAFATKINKAASIGATLIIKNTLKGSRRPNGRLLKSQINSMVINKYQKLISSPKNEKANTSYNPNNVISSTRTMIE